MSPLSFFTVKASREGGSFTKRSVVHEAKITRRNRFATLSSWLVVGWMCKRERILCMNHRARWHDGVWAADPFPEKLTSFPMSDFSVVRGGKDMHVQGTADSSSSSPTLVPLMDASHSGNRWVEAAEDENRVCSHAYMLDLLEELSMFSTCGTRSPFFSVSCTWKKKKIYFVDSKLENHTKIGILWFEERNSSGLFVSVYALVFSPTLVFHPRSMHVCLRCCHVWDLRLSPFAAAGVLLTVSWRYSRPLTQPRVIWFVLWVIMLKRASVWALLACCPEW